MAKSGRKPKDAEEPFVIADFWDRMFSITQGVDYYELLEFSVVGVALDIAINNKGMTLTQFAECLRTSGRTDPRSAVYGLLGKSGQPQRLHVADMVRMATKIGNDLNGLAKITEYALNTELRRRKHPIQPPGK